MTSGQEFMQAVRQLHQATQACAARLAAGRRATRRLAGRLVLARLAAERARARHGIAVSLNGEPPLSRAEEVRLAALLDQVQAAEAEHGRRLGAEWRSV